MRGEGGDDKRAPLEKVLGGLTRSISYYCFDIFLFTNIYRDMKVIPKERVLIMKRTSNRSVVGSGTRRLYEERRWRRVEEG